VVFSYSFFLEGMTGIRVTVVSVVTLAVLMGMTTHLDWNEVFTKTKDAPRLRNGDGVETA